MSGPLTTETGLPWALVDRLVQTEVEARVLGESTNPVKLGRYRIEGRLGAGAMGQLLLAYDPDLERRVALKLLAPALSSSDVARKRIVGEARAMAKLSDPHVAQVYEVDEAQGQIFVAIEYIDGQNLRQWLAAAPRGWMEILAVFLQAGAGLAAAHAKGIVHRDFKLDNVMLERDGRACVVDFGLARARVTAGREGLGMPAHLTRTGALLGTPGYMAPELWDGAEADARSDQFAFCVSLYEALVGRRPFEGDTAEAVREAHARGIDARDLGKMRRFVARALRRGLGSDPAARWPDMPALSRALDPSRRRRRTVAWGFAALAVTSTTAAWLSRTDPCADAGAEIDEVWNDGRRAAMEAALHEVDPRWGPTSAAPLAARLDGHADAWRAAARGLCSGGAVEEEAARGCLRESRQRLAEIVDETISGGASHALSAVGRAELLVDPQRCADAPALAAYARDAQDPAEARAFLAEARHQLGVLSVRSGAEAWVDAVGKGRRAATSAVAAAEAVGHEPILARSLWIAGRFHLHEGATGPAERDLRRALVVAREVADAPLAAAIVAELVYAVGRDQDRFREAADLADEAAAMIGALGNPPLLDAKLRTHRGSVIAHCRGCDRTPAVALHEQALTLTVQTLGREHPTSITARGNLGSTLSYADRPAEALERLAEAIEAANETWGADHPRTALLLGTRGLTRMRAGDLAGAETDLRRSHDVRRTRLGPEHVQVDDARYNLALALRRQQRHAEALPLLETGLTNARRRLGPDDPRLGAWWMAAGDSALRSGDDERAAAYLTGALRLFERTGAGPDDYARARIDLARAYASSDPARARMIAEQALVDAMEGGAQSRREDIERFLQSL